MNPSTSNHPSSDESTSAGYYTRPSYYPPPGAQGASATQYSYPQNAWSNTNAYPYHYVSNRSAYTTDTQAQPPGYWQNTTTWPPQAQYAAATPKTKLEPRPSPTPPPPPKLPDEWNLVIRKFLADAGLTQALRGFELDFMVLNEERERKVVPDALSALREGLVHLHNLGSASPPPKARSLDERKLDVVHLASQSQPVPPTSLTKSISAFLAQTRARNDASNRAEFLISLDEQRQHVLSRGDIETSVVSCARVDARPLDHDKHMKYDIAQNDEGPLRRTVKTGAQTATGKSQPNSSAPPLVSDAPSAARHPGIDERLKNVEAHFAVRYVPAPPVSLLDRLKHLEEHIIRLEKEHPPWAALHFNQPRRGWPAPPRQTPILVDPRTTVGTLSGEVQGGEAAGLSATVAGDGRKGKAKVSSLHRAVMEKLEVQKVKEELGASGTRAVPSQGD